MGIHLGPNARSIPAQGAAGGRNTAPGPTNNHGAAGGAARAQNTRLGKLPEHDQNATGRIPEPKNQRKGAGSPLRAMARCYGQGGY